MNGIRNICNGLLTAVKIKEKVPSFKLALFKI